MEQKTRVFGQTHVSKNSISGHNSTILYTPFSSYFWKGLLFLQSWKLAFCVLSRNLVPFLNAVCSFLHTMKLVLFFKCFKRFLQLLTGELSEEKSIGRKRFLSFLHILFNLARFLHAAFYSATVLVISPFFKCPIIIVRKIEKGGPCWLLKLRRMGDSKTSYDRGLSRETHTENGGPVCLLAQLAGRWGPRNWNCVR